jgi:hypothetical protein
LRQATFRSSFLSLSADMAPEIEASQSGP